MAYADTSTTTRRTGTAIAVLALEAGLAWALINGFAMQGEGKLRDTFTAIFIPKEKQPRPRRPRLRRRTASNRAMCRRSKRRRRRSTR